MKRDRKNSIYYYIHLFSWKFFPQKFKPIEYSCPQLLLLAPPTFKTNSSTKQRAVMNLSHSTIGKKGFNM